VAVAIPAATTTDAANNFNLLIGNSQLGKDV
jgi:hypothetical protein